MSRVALQSKFADEKLSTTVSFLSQLAVGETIASAICSATVYSGTDASPSTILSGSASISGTKVIQKVTGGVLGVTYLLLCTATTSAGQSLQLSAYLCVVPDNE